MNTQKNLLVSLLAAVLMVSCATPLAIAAPAENETGTIDAVALNAVMSQAPLTALTPVEIDDLEFMREEEKLAHDVYVTLFQKWNISTFQNIAVSEQTHTDSVKVLLDRYGAIDPTIGKSVGQFANPELQKLYDTLIVQGSQSAAEALKVGAAIEEIDILDLEKRLARTEKADIRWVYDNLKTGSYNHLRAFTRNMGQTYTPQYLSLAAYNAIISTQSGNGRGRR